MARDKANYDVSEVVKKYNLGAYGEVRHSLIKELRMAMAHNPPVLELIASIMEHTLGKGHNEADCCGFSLMTGMALGILLEQERITREGN